MDVPGTNVSLSQCINYHCETNPKVDCPPFGLPECPGGVDDCENVPGSNYSYQMQPVRVGVSE